MIHTPVSNIVRYPDAQSLAEAAASFVLAAAKDAIEKRGRFTVALSGGSSPEKTYALLAKGDPSGQTDYSRWHVFLSDERFVPLTDPHSNYAMIERSLLATGLIPKDQVYPVPMGAPSAEVAAGEYGHMLAKSFDVPPGGPPPHFDLILLGMGEDGHTASLFPDAKALTEKHHWVTSSPPGVLPPPIDRITFTFPLINAARHVLFLVTGANKTKALLDVFAGHPSIAFRPAVGVRPTAGELTWYIDSDAAHVHSSAAK